MNAKTILLRFHQKAIDRTTAISLLSSCPDYELKALDLTSKMRKEIMELKNIIADKLFNDE